MEVLAKVAHNFDKLDERSSQIFFKLFDELFEDKTHMIKSQAATLLLKICRQLPNLPEEPREKLTYHVAKNITPILAFSFKADQGKDREEAKKLLGSNYNRFTGQHALEYCKSYLSMLSPYGGHVG